MEEGESGQRGGCLGLHLQWSKVVTRMSSRGWFLSQDLRHSSKILGGLRRTAMTETSLLVKMGSSGMGKGLYLEM